MRHQTKKFIENFMKEKEGFVDILDVGSLEVETSGNIRSLFPSLHYTGVDMRPGPNVDIVANGHELSKHFPLESFDLVVCFDTLEHDDAFWLTIEQMKLVLRKGGYLLIGVPGRAAPLHNQPDDYWRFMESAFKVFFKDMGDAHIEVEYHNVGHEAREIEAEIYGWAKKP